MCKKMKLKLALWAACLVVGSSVLFAQWSLAARREVPDDPVPVAVTDEESWLFAPLAKAAEPVIPDEVANPPVAAVQPVAAPKAVEPQVDAHLVARLLVDSVTQVESAGNPRLIGSHGERGLMQIKPGAWGDVTRRLFGHRVSFDRAFEGKLNQQVGSAYLADLQRFLSRHQKVWKADERSLLLACYNAGPERVKRAGFDLRRLPAHTQDYVKRAAALHDALLADHHVDPARIRLALATQIDLARGT